MKKIYLLLALLLLVKVNYAQTAASYSYSRSTGTFSSISSASGVTASPSYFNCDDCAWGSLSLGFNFVFCGTTYTSLAASSNGYLSLANSTAGGYPTYVNATSSMYAMASGVGFLMCFWDDNYGFSGYSRAYYITTGSAPNRVFTFEWNNWGRCCSSSYGFDYYQVKLYETTNVIEYWYGSRSISSTSATIGIANSSSDYQTLNNSSSTATSSSSSFNSSVTPLAASGQIYRWSPNCMTLTPTNDGPVCAGGTINFSGTVASGSATGYSWSGPSGFSSTLQNPTITGITAAQAGVYTFVATASGCTDTAYTTVVIDSTPTATISGTAAICSGGSSMVTFTGTAGATVNYQINGGSTLSVTLPASGTTTVSTGTLTTGSTSTTYTYTLISATRAGCTGTLTGSIVVTVNPVPSAISGSSSVCVGQTIALTDADAGGTWTSSNASIASVSGSGTTGTVRGNATGTATITYTFASGCYVTTSITVNPLPAAITGPRVVCPTATISLASSTTGGTWTSSTTSVATAGSTSGIVTGVSSGLTIITYTIGTGCYVTDSITVSPLPSVFSGPTAVCVGSAITLSSTPTGGTWTSGSTSVATVISTSGVVTGVTGGGVTLTYTAPSTCYRTGSITVNPIPSAITGTFSVCEGGNTSNLYNSTSGGTWSSSNTSLATISSSGVVTGITRGTVTITYTITSTGCYITAPITINALPSIITGPSVVCAGNTITLSDSVSGGTWSSSNTAVATINSSTGVVTGNSAGSTTITYFLGSGCTATKTITVNPLPAAITGTMAVCEAGSTMYLADATPSGAWTSGNTGIATIDGAGMVTGVSAGTVNITYALIATGCLVSTAVTVNPLPATISGPSALCVASTINLTNTSAGGSWTSSNTAAATINGTGVVTGVASGSTNITYTLPTGCITTTTVNVNGLPSAISGASVLCAGLNTTYTNTVSGGTWTSGNTAIATVNSGGLVTAVAAGTTDITYTLGSGCLATSSLTVNPLPAAISGAYDVCYTFNTTFTNATGGGTWSSGNTSIATISTTGVITGVTVGSTTITYTLSTGCLQTQAITVDPLPSAIGGATNVCVNSTVTLTDASAGGTWSSSNAGVATVDATSGVVTGVAAGTTTITYTLAGGCYITMNMTVNPLPSAITGTASVCEGGTVTLSNPSGTGTWASSNTALATVGSSSGVVTGVTAGTLNITFTLPTTCNITRTFVVNPTPTAITGTTNACEAGATSILGNALPGGTWTTSNASIATASTTTTTTGTVTGVSAGTVTVTYTVGTCYNTTSFTVNALPGAVITPLGDTMMCPGGFVVLASSTGTGYTYQWYTGTGAISGETDDYYIASAGANYQVSVVNTLGCRSISSPMAVSINPATAIAAAAGATTVCNGSSATLNANTGTGLTYQWMLGSTGIAGATSSVYYATVTGAYNVIVSNTVGCSATSSSVSVNILPSPSANIVSTGALAFCNGGSVTLTADTGTGVSYQWQVGGSNISGATNINYTATTSGNYQVVVTNSYPCSSTSTVATVNALPLPNTTITTSGSSTFCTGGSVFLSVAAVSGNTYQWYRNGIAITGATGPNYNAMTGGNYTTRIVSAAGCSDITFPAFQVSELTVPIVTPLSATKFCWGGSAVLGVSVSLSTGVTYQWRLGGVDIAGATNSVYSANTSGNYSCNVTISGGCSSSSAPVTLTQYPLPNPVIYYDGTTLRTGGYYVSYQWFRNLTPIPGVGPQILPENIGSFTVKVIDTNGCQSVSTAYIVRSLGINRALGIDNVSGTEISIFPNPATSMIHIESPLPVRAIINALDGRKIMEQANASDINISQLADGVYMLMLFDGEGQMVKAEKLIKQ